MEGHTTLAGEPATPEAIAQSHRAEERIGVFTGATGQHRREERPRKSRYPEIERHLAVDVTRRSQNPWIQSQEVFQTIVTNFRP
jgi:hypothetical protein